MAYDDVELDLQRWADNFSLLEYPPVRRANTTTYLILDFKENQPLALEKVRQLAIQAFREMAPHFSRYTYGYLVALPSSKQDQPNSPCEYICSALARQFPRFVHLQGALRRVTAVQKSATASPGMRPDYDTHLGTIEYVGPSPLPSNSVVIMIDDVYTRGETSRACRDILRAATRCKDVLGCFIGRTS